MFRCPSFLPFKMVFKIEPKAHRHWSVVAVRSSALDSISSGVVRMWVRIPAASLVSLSKTLNHNCFVLRMGRKAVDPVCCVMRKARKRTQDTYREREGGLPWCFWNGSKMHRKHSQYVESIYVSCNAHLYIWNWRNIIINAIYYLYYYLREIQKRFTNSVCFMP